MTERKWVVRLVGVFAFTAACSNAPSQTDGSMTVQGTVSSALQANGAQAVALGADGRSFWSALDASGEFTLVMPTGQSYRIVLAQQSSSGPVAVAFLAVTTSAGKTQWIAAKSTTTLRLGTLVPATMLASVQASAGVKTQSDGTDTMTADGSGRGGSGRGGTDVSTDGSGRGGSGRGGSDTASTGDDDDDDASHGDDPPCHEGGIDDDKVCPASAGTTEMASSRDGAEDVSDCGDSSKVGDNAAASCSSPPAPGAGGTSGADGTPAGGTPAGGPTSGGAGASSGVVAPPPASPPPPPPPPPPQASPGVN